MQYCQSVNCEVVQAPSDTSQFLQHCAMNVRNFFKKAIRHFRDFLCKQTFIDVNSVRIGLMLGVLDFYSITMKDIVTSMAFGQWNTGYLLVSMASERITYALKTLCCANRSVRALRVHYSLHHPAVRITLLQREEPKYLMQQWH